MREQNVQREGASSQASPATANATNGASRGVQLKHKAAQAGDVSAQEDALKPGSGLLSPGKVEDALDYNAKRARRQGAGWIKGLQGLVGAPLTGAYDAPTVEGVAKRQDDDGLRVDGKVGPKTEKALGPKIAKAPAAEKPAAGGEAKDQEAAGGANAPAPAAQKNAAPADPDKVAAPVAVPKPAAKDADAKATEAAPPDVKGLLQRLDTVLVPISVLDKDKLDLGTLTSWPAERGKVLAEAIALVGTLPAGADRTSLEKAIASAATFAATVVGGDGKRVRDHAIKLVNDASVLKDPKQQPTLPTRADVQAYQAGLRALGAAAGAALVAKSGLKDAVTVAQDGALALFQGLSVLAARATWKKGVVEPGAAGVAAANKDKDNALKGIFQDAGWGDITTTTSTKDGVEYKKVADWCGMFVGSHLFRGGGLDEELRSGFLHTSNVIDYFNYSQKANAKRSPRSIWADGEWHDLKTYHGARGSDRKWTSRATVTSVMEAGGALDIRPGDVVLIDHSGTKTSPQHITMVESYDPGTKVLNTIEGNTGGIQAPDGKVKGEDGQERWKKHRGPDGSGVHHRDLTNMSKGSRATHKEQHEANKAALSGGPKGAYQGTKGSTVFGVGRPSAVDFEEHSYATHSVPADMKKMSPEEMRALAQKKGKAAAAAKKAGVHKPK
ncbi:MAG: hypothetical protein EP329_17785 [Deltaproteobacteria bacterium]|nr:MAG: hypothetical protein EP329_17785 [Deltaproteobacteria bacterium]